MTDPPVYRETVAWTGCDPLAELERDRARRAELERERQRRLGQGVHRLRQTVAEVSGVPYTGPMTETSAPALPAELRTRVVSSALRAMRADATVTTDGSAGTQVVPADGQWERVRAALESFGFRPLHDAGAMVVPADQVRP